MGYREEPVIEQALPANVGAEKTILGAILLDNEAFFDATEDLVAEDFHLDSHRRIYIRMNEILFGMVEGVKNVDIVTLSNELTRNHEIEAVGGIAYLASLTEGLPRRMQVGEYVRIVKEKSRLRRLMAVFSTGVTKAQDQSESSSNIIGDIGDQLIDLEAEGSNHAAQLGSIDIEAEIEGKRSISNEKKALELTWGVEKLDEFTHGCFKGEWSIVAAESSGGKTAFSIQMLIANAKEGRAGAIFSMEMSKEQVKKRCYPALGEIITANHTRDPRLMNAHTHVPELRRLSTEMSPLPIYVDDTSPLRIDKLIARMRVLRRKANVELFVVDYLQLIEPPGKMNDIQGFKKIIWALRDFPKQEPGCHLVVLSQYSKADGFTRNKKRTKDSLYGGSIIHHAAQNILMITIEEPEKRDRLDLLDVEIKIAKQREGPRGKVTTCYDRDHFRFRDPQPFLRGV